MTPTAELRTRLRKLLNELIPPNGTEADTRFTDDDLDEMLTESSSLFAAASMGWTMKAGMLQTEMGDVERLTLGQETEQLVSLRDRLAYALGMADKYASMAKSSGVGSVMLRTEPAEVYTP